MAQYNLITQYDVHQFSNLGDFVLSQFGFFPVLLENLQIYCLENCNSPTEFSFSEFKDPFHGIFMGDYFCDQFLVKLVLVLVSCLEAIGHRLL